MLTIEFNPKVFLFSKDSIKIGMLSQLPCCQGYVSDYAYVCMSVCMCACVCVCVCVCVCGVCVCVCVYVGCVWVCLSVCLYVLYDVT